jgi:hypothetical protein
VAAKPRKSWTLTGRMHGQDFGSRDRSARIRWRGRRDNIRRGVSHRSIQKSDEHTILYSLYIFPFPRLEVATTLWNLFSLEFILPRISGISGFVYSSTYRTTITTIGPSSSAVSTCPKAHLNTRLTLAKTQGLGLESSTLGSMPAVDRLRLNGLDRLSRYSTR